MVYLPIHEWLICLVNVKDSSPMDPMGIFLCDVLFGERSHVTGA